MKYKVGDRIKIQSIERYNKHKNKSGNINYGCETEILFTSEMSSFCGQVATITRVQYIGGVRFYRLAEDKEDYLWVDGMFEGPEENENNHIIETVVDTVRESNDRYRIVLDPRFDIEVDEGEYYAVRRKKEYPKTYEECCRVLGYSGNYNMILTTDVDNKLFNVLYRLKVCRDAYWKIAGEEMGLGKPWSPRWDDGYQEKWIINFYKNEINLTNSINVHFVLAFPTEEMRDAFKENFDPDIEICKELL